MLLNYESVGVMYKKATKLYEMVSKESIKLLRVATRLAQYKLKHALHWCSQQTLLFHFISYNFICLQYYTNGMHDSD